MVRNIEKILSPLGNKIGGQKHLSSIVEGVMIGMPFLIIGSFFAIIQNFPSAAFQNTMIEIFGYSWSEKVGYPAAVSYHLMMLFTSFGVSYQLASKYKGLESVRLGLLSMVCFVLIVPEGVSISSVNANDTSPNIFTAILVGIFVTEICRWAEKRDLRRYFSKTIPVPATQAIGSLFPIFCAILLFWLLRVIGEVLFHQSINEIISGFIAVPFDLLAATLPGMVITSLMMGLFWSIGIHGDSLLAPFVTPSWMMNMQENMNAYQAGSELPNIITQQFNDLFVMMGGTGVLVGLILAMWIGVKSKQLKQIRKIVSPAIVFNICEPAIFSLPIVLNPILLIPFLLAPICVVITTYVAMSMGIVASPAGIAIPWTMPPIISGYLATGGRISGAMIQIVNIVLVTVIYYPFVRIFDKQKVREEQKE